MYFTRYDLYVHEKVIFQEANRSLNGNAKVRIKRYTEWVINETQKKST
jgi:hypothetical protein